jgi:hypothetical protein
MKHSIISIVTLCNELLPTILKKLNNSDVLYSLIGVNKKLDKLARDITFTRSIDFKGEQTDFVISSDFSKEEKVLLTNQIAVKFISATIRPSTIGPTSIIVEHPR